MNAVQVDDLTKVYGHTTALDGISFAIEPGTVLGLLGRNGSGKTTTVRILATLTLPSLGRATVAGYDVAAHPAHVRQRIGVTMQSAALDPEMTGREHLELICGAWDTARRTARDHAADLLAEFGLTDAADRVIATYSGGMRRRLDIAGALANQPEVLFLDEPTTGLDAQSRRALWNRVQALRDAGTAILLTTQYLEEADVLADELAVLHHGRIVATGTPTHIKKRHGSTTLRVRLADPREQLVNGNAADNDGWLTVRVTSTAAALQTLDEARAAGVELADVVLTPPTLEDAFLALTGTTVEPTGPDPEAPALTGATR